MSWNLMYKRYRNKPYRSTVIRKKPAGTLLAGSSIIRDITQKNFQLDRKPICIRAGKVTDITNELLKLPTDSKYETIILQIGSNDCSNTTFMESDFSEDYENLIKVAKLVSENIVISGLCHRLDDVLGYIRKGNNILERIASDENCHYIDNEAT